MFWSISLLVLLIAGVFTLGPLLGKGVKWKPVTLAGILLVPLAGYLMYQGVGTPQALDPAMVQAPDQAEIDRAHASMTDLGTLTERLHQRLQENPDDVEGWLLLGRSYKNLQNYPAAIEALETADRLSPGVPLVQVELVEARLFASGNAQFTPEMTTKLEQAVAAEPSLQKGLWLLGIAAAQSGNDAGALEWWEKLRAQLEPGSEIEQSLLAQINQVRARLGQAPEVETASAPASMTPPMGASMAASTPATASAPPGSATAAQGMDIRVELSAAASQAWPQLPAGTVPPGAVLFIIARPQGVSGGPPLGARRVMQPQFPLQLTLTDADSMVPQRPISSADQVELQARLSLSGRPTPSPGDWQSVASAVGKDAQEATRLTLDQRVE